MLVLLNVFKQSLLHRVRAHRLSENEISFLCHFALFTLRICVRCVRVSRCLPLEYSRAICIVFDSIGSQSQCHFAYLRVKMYVCVCAVRCVRMYVCYV